MLNAQRSALNAPLPGWVNTYYRYHRGKKLGPYHVRRWKVGPRLFKQYIKPSDLEKIKSACERYREKRKRQSAFAREYTLQESNLNYLLRLCKRLRRGALRQEDYAFALEIERNGYSIPGRPKLRASQTFMVPNFTNCRNVLPSLDGRGRGVGEQELLNMKKYTRISKPISSSVPIPTTQHSKPELLAILQSESEKILRSLETTEQKLDRWRGEINSMGFTTQRIPVPDWITEEEMESSLEGLVFPTYNHQPTDDEFRLPMRRYD